MAKIHFTFPVKYNKVVYGAYQPFEVADEDLPMLIQQGAILMEQAKISEPVVEKPKEEETPKKVKTTKDKGRLSVES